MRTSHFCGFGGWYLWSCVNSRSSTAPIPLGNPTPDTLPSDTLPLDTPPPPRIMEPYPPANEWIDKHVGRHNIPATTVEGGNYPKTSKKIVARERRYPTLEFENIENRVQKSRTVEISSNSQIVRGEPFYSTS